MPDFQRIDRDATYTCAEAAALVGVAKGTVRVAATAGKLAATLTGTGYRITGRDLLVWRDAVTARTHRGPRSSPARLPIDPDATYPLTTAARARDISVNTLRAALDAGQVPGTKARGRWAIRGADLLAWTPRWQAIPPGMLSVSQAMATVGLRKSWVRRAIREKRLRARRVDGLWVVDPEDLAAWRRSVEGAPTDTAIDPRGLYKIADAATALGVSRQRLYQLADAGRLPIVETPHGKRVRGADLLARWQDDQLRSSGPVR